MLSAFWLSNPLTNRLNIIKFFVTIQMIEISTWLLNHNTHINGKLYAPLSIRQEVFWVLQIQSQLRLV